MSSYCRAMMWLANNDCMFYYFVLRAVCRYRTAHSNKNGIIIKRYIDNRVSSLPGMKDYIRGVLPLSRLIVILGTLKSNSQMGTLKLPIRLSVTAYDL